MSSTVMCSCRSISTLFLPRSRFATSCQISYMTASVLLYFSVTLLPSSGEFTIRTSLLQSILQCTLPPIPHFYRRSEPITTPRLPLLPLPYVSAIIHSPVRVHTSGPETPNPREPGAFPNTCQATSLLWVLTNDPSSSEPVSRDECESRVTSVG